MPFFHLERDDEKISGMNKKFLCYAKRNSTQINLVKRWVNITKMNGNKNWEVSK